MLAVLAAVAEHQTGLAEQVRLGKVMMVGEDLLTGQVLHLVAVVAVQVAQGQMVETQALAVLVATELHLL
jgi:hypothetical protein